MMWSFGTIACETNDKTLIVSILSLEVVYLAFREIQKALIVDAVSGSLNCDKRGICSMTSRAPLLSINHSLWSVRTKMLLTNVSGYK